MYIGRAPNVYRTTVSSADSRLSLLEQKNQETALIGLKSGLCSELVALQENMSISDMQCLQCVLGAMLQLLFV